MLVNLKLVIPDTLTIRDNCNQVIIIIEIQIISSFIMVVIIKIDWVAFDFTEGNQEVINTIIKVKAQVRIANIINCFHNTSFDFANNIN